MINHIIKNLRETERLLRLLSPAQYNKRQEVLTDASIGQHVRHVLEFYQCLFSSRGNGRVNYDSRARNLLLETDIEYALATIEEVVDQLVDVKTDFAVTFVADFSSLAQEEPELIRSSFYRELAYNLEHSIHHQALIKVAINEMKLTSLLTDTFGYAPSTIRHMQQCAQ